MAREHVLQRRPLVLDQRSRERYFLDGFLAVPGHIDARWLERLRAVVAAKIEESRALTGSDDQFDLVPDHSAEKPNIRRLRKAVDQHPELWAFAQDPKPGEAYNLGGGRANAASLLECVELVAEASGGRRPVLTYDERARVGDHICYYSDMAKFREHFPGWQQEHDLPGIVEEMVAALATDR